MAESHVKKPVMVFFEEKYHFLECDQQMTMAEVRKKLQEVDRPISVAFFTHDDRYLPDDSTIAEALASSTTRSLELHAFLKSTCWLQVFGFDDTRVQFEVADVLTPAAVRREVGAALDIFTDDFRVTMNGAELDQELPFKQQGFMQGVLLMADLRVIVKVNFDGSDETRTLQCFSSECIADVHRKLNLGDDTALSVTSPYHHFLADPLRVCYIVADHMDLQVPIELTAETKVMLAFEPITLEHLRQKLPIALSCTPVDLYDMISERFELTTEHRLTINGEELDNSKPLHNQLKSMDDVIQVDILRPCEVFDLWEDPWDINSYEEVYLYSTESAYALYLRDELNDQRLFHEDLNLTIFGSMVDIFGATSGQHKPVLVIDRDVERSLPMLTFDGVEQRLAWARSMLLDVVPTSGDLLPKEIMRGGHLLPTKSALSELRMTEDTLMIMDPAKIFISSEKKLRICRFAQGSTFGDVRARMKQLKGGGLHVGLKAPDWQIPDEAMNRKVDLEILLLTSAQRFQTKLTVTMNNQCFSCWFEPQQVSFSDVMINIGKQAKVMPRHLFKRSLYCCGCGRQLSKKEEPHQAIPATCCSVRSLQLTDRRVKDVGIQTATPRKRDVDTYTLDPESRDACVGTESTNRRIVTSVTPELESTAVSPPSSVSLGILVESPEGDREVKVVTTESGSCRGLLATVDRRFREVSLGDSPVVFCQEFTYDRDGENRIALGCLRKKSSEHAIFFDQQDGKLAAPKFSSTFSDCFLFPSSPLPSFSHFPRLIIVKAEAEVLTVTKKRQLEAAPVSALTDCSFVVLLFGIRSGANFFWELGGTSYVDAESGRTYNRSRIPGGSKCFVFALMGNQNPVPRINISKEDRLIVLRRDCPKLRVEKGCVRCAGPPQATDVTRWSFPARPDALEKAFIAAARQT